MNRTVLFVCTGNICRSPMAEYLLRARLDSGSPWIVTSAGLAAARGMPASSAAIHALSERGIDLSGHRSRPLDEDLIDGSEIVVVMTRTHREEVRDRFPSEGHKVFLLNAFNPAAHDEDVVDPIGLPVEFYQGIRDEMEAALPGLIAFMKSMAAYKGGADENRPGR